MISYSFQDTSLFYTHDTVSKLLAFDTAFIKIDACIKGYQAYKYKPTDWETLLVKQEYGNKCNRFAVVVWLPGRHILAVLNPKCLDPQLFSVDFGS